MGVARAVVGAAPASNPGANVKRQGHGPALAGPDAFLGAVAGLQIVGCFPGAKRPLTAYLPAHEEPDRAARGETLGQEEGAHI